MRADWPTMPLQISTELRQKLHQIREEQLGLKTDQFLASIEGVRLLSGPVSGYLTLDGQVLLDPTILDPELGVINASYKDIAMFLYEGSRLHRLPELIELLPSPPEDSVICPTCRGKRVIEHSNRERLCNRCHCRGWIYGA